MTNLLTGITNQRETAVVWSRKTGKPLSRAIVWDDARTRDLVAHFEKKLRDEGIEHDGEVKKGEDAVAALKKLSVEFFLSSHAIS
jgi:glycerol kinase